MIRNTKYAIRPHLLPVGLLLAATLIFFWPVVLGTFTPARAGAAWIIPQGGGDLVSFLWPTYRYAAQSLRRGELPLWNPHLYSGAPYLADNQSGLFYPPNLFLALLPDVTYTAMQWLVVLHVFFAGVGMYTLLAHELIFGLKSPIPNPQPFGSAQDKYPISNIQSHGIRGQGAGLVAALAYQFSSVFVTHIGNLNIVVVSAWLPWVVFCLRRMATTRRARWAVALGGSVAAAVLAGHAQMTLVVVLAAGLAGLWELARANQRRALVALGGLAVATAVGLTALAVLPATEMTQHTARSDFSYEAAARYSLPPTGLAGMLSPLLFGRGARAFWPTWDRVELGYAGVVTLFLAGLAVGRRSRRYPAILMALVGLLIALGQYTPVHRWLFNVVPGFGQLRVPARFILLTDFALAYLAGLGWADWRAARVTVRRVAIWGGALGLTMLVGMPWAWVVARDLSGGIVPRTLAPAMGTALLTLLLAAVLGWRRWWSALPVLLAIELIGFGAWVEVDRGDPDSGYRAGPAVEFLQAQPGPFRIDVAATAWQPDAPAVHALESVSGVSNPLALARYDAYYWSVGYRGSPQYNFLNVQFLVTDKGRPAADATFVPVFDEDPYVDVYLNTNAQPRIHLIYDPVFVADEQAAFDAIHAPDFYPEHRVVLEGGAPISTTVEGERNLYYVEYTTHRQMVVAVTPAPAYLVFGEVWYPGWRATVDGAPAEILRANYAFRAVYLPAGEHMVEIRFQPRTWRMGLGITLGTLAGLALVGGYMFRPAWNRTQIHADFR